MLLSLVLQYARMKLDRSCWLNVRFNGSSVAYCLGSDSWFLWWEESFLADGHGGPFFFLFWIWRVFLLNGATLVDRHDFYDCG